jgi:hypothetical protein
LNDSSRSNRRSIRRQFAASLIRLPHLPQRRIVDHGGALCRPQVGRTGDVVPVLIDASQRAQVGSAGVAEGSAIPVGPADCFLTIC